MVNGCETMKNCNNKKTYLKIGIMFCFLLLTLTACTAGGRTHDDPAGFFAGVWHGWIAPFVLLFSIFDDSLTIYETYNIGFWYNLGFYMAIISGFGSLSLFRKSK